MNTVNGATDVDAKPVRLSSLDGRTTQTEPSVETFWDTLKFILLTLKKKAKQKREEEVNTFITAFTQKSATVQYCCNASKINIGYKGVRTQ